MAVQAPRFGGGGFSGSSGAAVSGAAALGQGLAEMRDRQLKQRMMSAQEEKQQQQAELQQKMLGEGAVLSSIAYEDDEEARNSLISVFKNKADDKFRMELEELQSMPIEEQNAIIRSALTEDGLIQLLPSSWKEQVDDDFIKEERGYAKETVTRLKKRAAEIRGAYGKIESLVPQIKKGSRSATSGAIMSMARLISPGVVTDKDAAAIAGAPSPGIAFYEFLIEKGDREGAEQVMRAFDPANPKYFDADGLLEMAKSVTAAEAPSILQELDEAKQRATTAGMNERQFKTNFGNVGTIEYLKRFTQPVTGATQGKITTKAQFDALPSGSIYVGEDGKKYRKP